MAIDLIWNSNMVTSQIDPTINVLDQFQKTEKKNPSI